MRFLLVGRDRSTAAARLVSDATFETRAEALDELGRLAGTGELSDVELFVVDLDAVTPVVLYQAPAAVSATPAGEPLEEPIADVWEAPSGASEGEPADAEPGDAETVAEDETPEEDTPEDETPEDDVQEDLSAALRRAASALEGAGIVAPPSVEEFAAGGASTGVADEGPADADEATEEPLAATLEVPPDEPAGEESLPEEPAAAAPTAEPPAATAWPWEAAAGEAEAGQAAVAPAEEDGPVEAPAPETVATEDAIEDMIEVATEDSIGEAAGEPVDEQADEPGDADEATSVATVPVFEPVGLDEPGLEEITLLTPGMAEDFSSATLVVGEYSGDALEDAAAGDDDEADEVSAELVADIADEAADIADEAADIAETEVARQAPDAEPSDEQPNAASEAMDTPRSEPKAYEPGGSEIQSYTCDECVYVATCPKHHQDRPATCGSFQWKPV